MTFTLSNPLLQIKTVANSLPKIPVIYMIKFICLVIWKSIHRDLKNMSLTLLITGFEEMFMPCLVSFAHFSCVCMAYFKSKRNSQFSHTPHLFLLASVHRKFELSKEIRLSLEFSGQLLPVLGGFLVWPVLLFSLCT